MAGLRKDAQRLRRTLETEYGCTVTLGKQGHWKVTLPGCQPVFISDTPSDQKALRNIKGDVRRHLGIEL